MMNKLLQRILMVILVLGGVLFICEDSVLVHASSNAPYIKFGDINFDGMINEKDIELLQQHIAATKSDKTYKEHPDWRLTGKAFQAADTNCDSEVDITDLTKILRHISMEKGESYISHIITVTLMDEGDKNTVYNCFPITYDWKDASKNHYPNLYKPSKSGYVFKGWYSNGKKAESNGSLLSTGDHILYARWEAEKNSNGEGYDNAVTLPTNGEWSGSYRHTDSNYEHWYKVELPTDGKLTFKAMSYASLLYKLYTEDLKEIGMHWTSNGTENSPNTVESSDVLSKGTYYFKVSPNGNKGRYKLNALFQKYAANDENAISYDSPQNLSEGFTVNGVLTETDLEDWYRIKVSEPKKYRINLKSYFSSCYIYLYNSDLSNKLLNRYLNGSETSPQTGVYNIDLSAGIYYLKIDRSIYSDAGRYILTLEDNIAVKKITMNKSSLTLGRYDGERLSVSISPSNAANQEVLWKSSNPSIAAVSDSGFVSARGAGTAIITATAADGSGATATCAVKVLEDPEVICQRDGHIGTWITKKQATALEKGSRYRVCERCHKKQYSEIAKLTPTAKVTASQITLKVKQSTRKIKVSGLARGDYITSWKSSNTGIVKVTKDGKITAQKKTGTATVTVTLASGKKVRIKVKVQKKEVTATKISGIPNALKIKRGTSKTLRPVVSPITCTQKITYKTSNKKVATVSSSGKITAKKKGNAVITVTCGKKKVKCKITVN